MQVDELIRMVSEEFPEGQLSEDLDGQLIIYTGLKSQDDVVVPFVAK